MSTRPVAVRPSRSRPGDATPAAFEPPPPSSYGAPPPELGYWGRWWQRKRMRVFVSLGVAGFMILWALFMDLTGR